MESSRPCMGVDYMSGGVEMAISVDGESVTGLASSMCVKRVNMWNANQDLQLTLQMSGY